MRTSLKVGLIAAFALVASTASTQAALTLPTMQCSYSFSSNMGLGARSASVMDLQKVLNMYPETKVASTGPGSAGMETMYYGPATMAAVKKFQAVNGISPVSGYTGPLTRAALNQVCTGASVSLPVGCTSTSGFSPVTGVACNTGASTSLPAGCTSAVGFSSITGLACNGGATVQTGPIVASIAATNPASGVIVAGQATADLLHFTLSGNGVVNSITLKRSGISDQNTLSNVYLYDGAARLTDGYSFNSTGDITMNNLGITVNGTKTLSVRADVLSTTPSGQTVAIWLTSLTSGATVSNVNLSGNTFAVASGSTLATASFGANTVTGTPSVNAGTTAYSFFSAPLQVNTRTVWLKGANFRMIGSAPSDAIANLRLFVNGVDTGATGTVWSSNGTNYVSFDFMAMPKSLTTGSHTIELRGNIEKGSNRTVQFSIQNASDVMLMDPQVGVNIAVTGTIPNNGATVTINTGSITINNDPAFQAMTNITGGASNVAIARYKLRGYGEDVKVQSLSVTPVLSGSTPSTGGLEDVTLYFNGSQVGTQQDWSSGSLSFSLGSQMIVPAGADSTLEVRANIRTSTSTNYTAGSISANLAAGSSNAQGQSSSNTISTPAVTGNVLTIQTGLLAVSKNPGYANQSVTPNTANVKIGSFVFQNQSSSEAVRVTALKVDLGFTGLQVITNYAALRTSETSGSGATPTQPTAVTGSSTTNTFSVDFTLAPGATKTIDVFADTGSITGGTVIVTLTPTSIGAQSNVSGSTSPVTGQTITIGAGSVTNPPTLVTASATQAQYIAAGNGGATDGTKATFNFVATGGSATISELKFTVTGSNTVSTVKVGNVTAPVVSGVAYLTGLTLNVPNGGSGLTQDVLISYSEVGTNGIVPGTTSSVALTEVKYTSGGTTTTFNPSVSAPTMTLVGSKPTVTVNTATVSGLNLAAENKIGEVTVAADAKGNIKLNDIKFTVGASNFTSLPTFTLARIADGSTTIAGSSCGQGTASSSSQTIFCEFGTSGNTFTTTTGTTNVESNTDYDGYTIAAGTSKTFSLYATVSAGNAGTGSATISTSVDAAGFNWDDTSYPVFVADGTTASPANGTNLTGSLIYNFPTGSYTIRQ